MTLHEAVLHAKKHNYRWLAIDANKSMWAYKIKPNLGIHKWDNTSSYQHKYIFLDVCYSPLGGNFTNWLIDLEELTL